MLLCAAGYHAQWFYTDPFFHGVRELPHNAVVVRAANVFTLCSGLGLTIFVQATALFVWYGCESSVGTQYGRRVFDCFMSPSEVKIYLWKTTKILGVKTLVQLDEYG